MAARTKGVKCIYQDCAALTRRFKLSSFFPCNVLGEKNHMGKEYHNLETAGRIAINAAPNNERRDAAWLRLFILDQFLFGPKRHIQFFCNLGQIVDDRSN